VSWRAEPPLDPAPATAQVDRDLPVPDGFELVRDASYRHERSSFRRLLLTYRRKEYLAKENVVDFIKARYPREGWEVTFVYGLETPHIVLTKGDEEVRATVSEDFGDTFTQVVFEVEPRQTPDGSLVASGEASSEAMVSTDDLPAPPSTTETGAETKRDARDVAPVDSEGGPSK
jgi:hypothetical protein